MTTATEAEKALQRQKLKAYRTAYLALINYGALIRELGRPHNGLQQDAIAAVEALMNGLEEEMETGPYFTLDP